MLFFHLFMVLSHFFFTHKTVAIHIHSGKALSRCNGMLFCADFAITISISLRENTTYKAKGEDRMKYLSFVIKSQLQKS